MSRQVEEVEWFVAFTSQVMNEFLRVVRALTLHFSLAIQASLRKVLLQSQLLLQLSFSELRLAFISCGFSSLNQ